MGKHVRHLGNDDYRKPAALVSGEPLGLIDADHLREREICALIDKIADGTVGTHEAIADVIHFLTQTLPLHLMDEEEDLFPLLKRRCTPEDNIGKIIARLHRDHDHANDDTPIVVSLLETLLENPRPLDGSEASTLTTFASHARRHLILENAIIVPFARLRLTEADLETLRIRMCQRRGIKSLKDI